MNMASKFPAPARPLLPLAASVAALTVGGALLVSGAAIADPVAAGVAETGEGKTVVICKEALAQPAAAAGCAAIFVLLNELNAKHPFGPNGEIMKVLIAPVKIVDGNFKGAERESGEGAKALRALFGISWRDMQRDGFWGGPNSFFRKPFG